MRSAWTDSRVNEEQFRAKSVGIGPLRSMLMRSLAVSKGQRMSAQDLLSAMSGVSQDALSSTIETAILDGVVKLEGSDISLTTLGHRAARSL